jgi:hypothetical protein
VRKSGNSEAVIELPVEFLRASALRLIDDDNDVFFKFRLRSSAGDVRTSAISRTGPPMLKTLMVVGAMPPMGNPAMVASNCDPVKIADAYVRTYWSYFNFTDRRRSTAIEGNVWKVRHLLPDGSLGYEPEISIDRKTCEVVGAILWQ